MTTRNLLTIFLLLVAIVLFPLPVQAQATDPFTEKSINYLFGEQITFVARMQPTQPAEAVYVIFSFNDGSVNERVEQVAVTPDGIISHTVNLTNAYIPPFSQITYRFRAVYQNGQTAESTPATVSYIDNRFPWKNLGDNLVVVSWYAGDDAFGQHAFDTAHRALTTIRTLIPAPQGKPIQIYIYDSTSAMQTALSPVSPVWAVGHANPELETIMVSISAETLEANADIERQIPHELAHILLYRYIGSSYSNVPLFVREGLATSVEQSVSSKYALALDTASANNTLFPMKDLCFTFPLDASGAFLAYAQSDSFTSFLLANYGNEKMLALLKAYQDGLGCEQAMEKVYGASLARLEVSWRAASLMQNVGFDALIQLAPLFFVVLVVIISSFLPIFLTRQPAAGKK